jgi:hypothetical protein
LKKNLATINNKAKRNLLNGKKNQPGHAGEGFPSITFWILRI